MEDTFDIRNNQELQETEREFENALRPLSFNSFSGQDKAVSYTHLDVYKRQKAYRP